ncbi:MAG: pyrroline-5-carboxylate reductase [Pseudomonadota bacterium]
MRKLGIIGCGKMATSIIKGLVTSGHLPSHAIIVSDVSYEQCTSVQQEFSVAIASDNSKVCESDVIILAIKPQTMKNVLTEIAPTILQHKPLIISIVAGWTIDQIRHFLNNSARIVRCMPNLPAAINSGITALYAQSDVDKLEHDKAQQILASVGSTLWLEKEDQMNAVTALSGSGPAYFFYLMEHMIQAGQSLGFNEALCRQLVVETALGAARLAASNTISPAELRRSVTSPAGTTEAALREFDQHAMSKTIQQGIQAAYHRSIELSKITEV